MEDNTYNLLVWISVIILILGIISISIRNVQTKPVEERNYRFYVRACDNIYEFEELYVNCLSDCSSKFVNRTLCELPIS